MDVLTNFIFQIVADVLSHTICKWIDQEYFGN